MCGTFPVLKVEDAYSFERFSGQVLGIVNIYFPLSPRRRLSHFGLQAQSAIDNRAVDTHFLFWVAGGRALCTAAEHVLSFASEKVTTALDARSRQLYSGRIFRSMARLDVPTWDNPAVSSHISSLSPKTRRREPDTVAWAAIKSLVEAGSAFLRMFSEAAVLFHVLREHGDGSWLVLASVASEAVSFLAFKGLLNLGDSMRDITSSISHGEPIFQVGLPSHAIAIISRWRASIA